MTDAMSPMEGYTSYLKEKHAALVSEYFDDLVSRSGVNEEDNARLVAEIRELEESVAGSKSTRLRLILGIVGLIVSVLVVTVTGLALGGLYLLLIAVALPLLYVLRTNLIPKFREVSATLGDLNSKRDSKMAEAWEQMAPLNQLHSWDVGRLLFQRAFPEVRLDRFMSAGRLADLHSNFNLDPDFNQGKSILIAQSGDHGGNPFSFIRYLQHWMGSKTYYGSVVIYWIENVRQKDGRLVGVQRSQTLTASVEKPFPEFAQRTHLLFGHDAAPNLNFSREPSRVSGLEDSFISNARKGYALKKVERKARRDVKTGSGQFTVMANHDFETQFGATNRDNEVEFRLLFSAYAQQEFVKLLNDKSIAYGDNFIFEKYSRLNAIEARHMSEIQFDGDPRIFASFDLVQAKKFFFEYHVEYFRALYFSLAPVLTVPLYKEKRTSDSALGANPGSEVSYWECEAMANFIGEPTFMHPDSITRNLLRATPSVRSDGSTLVNVNAYGYMGIHQVDVVQLWGRDGNLHDVPVEWVEYVPVARDTSLTIWPLQGRELIADADGESVMAQRFAASLTSRGVDESYTVRRNGLAAMLG